MKSFSLTFLISIVLGLFFISSSSATDLKKTVIQFTKQHSITSYNYGSWEIILFQPRKWGLWAEHTTKWTSAQYLWNLKTSCVAINGFYFWYGNNEEKFQPAGPLTIYKNLKSQTTIPSDTNPMDDVNLWINIFYNSLNNNVSLWSTIKIAKGISFFAGPMIISDGTINPELTKRISHRSTKHYRTFLIQDKNNKAIRWITTEKVSLTELGNALQSILKSNIKSVVNLDGGSSTSFASQKFSYNQSKSLPSFFHSCK